MSFVMNHAPGAGWNAPVDQQSSALPLYYGCPHLTVNKYRTIAEGLANDENVMSFTPTGLVRNEGVMSFTARRWVSKQ